ncbi:hypothetical protein [Microbacterium awajiense]
MILVNVRCDRCKRILFQVTRDTQPVVTADGSELLMIARCRCDLRTRGRERPAHVELPWADMVPVTQRARRYGKTQNVSFSVKDTIN